MKDVYKLELEKLYKQDIKDLKETFKVETTKVLDNLKKKSLLLKEAKKKSKETEDKLHEILNTPWVDNYDSRKAWKIDKKETKHLLKDLHNQEEELEVLVKKLQAKVEQFPADQLKDEQALKDHLKLLYAAAQKEDMFIFAGMKISFLSTKIKIKIVEYEKVAVPKNPRIGMSFGAKFKPRIFMSTNASTRYKNVKSRDDQYDIRKKDNLEERIIELSEILDISNPYNFYQYILFEAKKSVGSSYIKEFN